MVNKNTLVESLLEFDYILDNNENTFFNHNQLKNKELLNEEEPKKEEPKKEAPKKEQPQPQPQENAGNAEAGAASGGGVETPSDEQMKSDMDQLNSIQSESSGGESNENLSLDDLGKVYQMKKIYDNLLLLYDLSFDLVLHDKKTESILVYMKKLIDYYKLVINNLSKYKEKIDKIIDLYTNIIDRLMIYMDIKLNNIQKNSEGV